MFLLTFKLDNVSRDEAMTLCVSVMESSVAYNACAEIRSTYPDDTLRLCVEDIMVRHVYVL